MKKFLATICAAFMLMTPAQAEDLGVELSDIGAGEFNTPIEKFYATLPQAKGDYKSRQRPIIIEGAMNTETEVLIRALKNPVAYRELNYLFVAGTYKDYPVVIVRTEIGMANAAASTALAIKKFNPVAVINQGTAGGHDPALKIGDIVIGERSFDNTAYRSAYSAAGVGIDLTKQENIGTYAYDKTSGKFQAYTEYFSDSTLFNIAFKVANANKNFNVVSGVIGTGNTWLECVDYVNFLHEKYGSSCEEMETNVAAQICQNAGIPFIGIRVLSDNVTNSREYVPETAKVAQDFVLLVVENYIRDVLKIKGVR
ncbi:MAG: 5'-methylthioadenosine/S-adenosylhomocysteine nucleosidase [Selenomonadaceae bacterium]|nr:5'-methylthioadenosine/S-adenosylhomocysteine nucleosidase [Selenomonadaceae bacterium]